MTDTAPLPPEDEADMQAAEYVLGVLPHGQRVLAAQRVKTDAAFAARVADWEARLEPLNQEFAEVAAPDLLPRIEARLFAAAPHPRFGFALLAGLLTATVLALGIFVSVEMPRDQELTARLAAEAQPLTFSATIDPSMGTLTLVRTAGDAPPPGQDLELWVIGADGVPSSLGLIRSAEETRAAPDLAPGMVLAVSLEPEGGSKTGQPTGPVLVTGVLTEG